MLDSQLKKDYEDGASVSVISKKYGVSPSMVSRRLKAMGVKMRTASEATKMALEQGRLVSPTKGKGHSDKARERMSKGRSEAWERGGEKARQEMSEIAKAKWAKKTEAEKSNLRSAAGRALRETGINGSAAENYLFKTLGANGYVVEHHNKQLMAGSYEIDLLLPDLGIVIELDGPQHYSPIFGDERFEKTKLYDTTKNGALIAKGLKVIRIKYVAKRFNQTVARKMWEALQKALNSKLENLTYIEF